jgi:hypothetical protein
VVAFIGSAQTCALWLFTLSVTVVWRLFVAEFRFVTVKPQMIGLLSLRAVQQRDRRNVAQVAPRVTRPTFRRV